MRALAQRRVWGRRLKKRPYQPPLPRWIEYSVALAYAALLAYLGLLGPALVFLAGDAIQALYTSLFFDTSARPRAAPAGGE